MALGYPERDGRLKADALAPIGLLARCSQSVAASCLALESVDAVDWSPSRGWGSYADASMRRGWIQIRQRKGLELMVSLMSRGGAGDDVQPEGSGWLNVVVLPDPTGGSTIEVRGDLDAEMYGSVRSAVRSLFVTIVRVWEPATP